MQPARTSPSPPSADLALVRAAQAGDRGAFEQLYRRHVARVHAICLRLSADATVAEELTQDTFVRAWQRLDALRSDAFGAWVRRVAARVALDDRRSHQRRLARVVPDGQPGATAGTSSSPGTALDLERAVRGLPPKARHVFVLREIEGLTHQEIAELCGVTAGTSKAQLHRARKLLRETLS